MSTYRKGNNYRVAIGLEVAPVGSGYTNGTAIRFDDLIILPDVFNCDPEVVQIATGAKTQTGLATTCENKPGYSKIPVTISGMLSDEHEILLKALTPDTASPYAVDALPTLKSYVILRIWSDVVSANNYIVDIAKGCQLMGTDGLVITGASGVMFNYTAKFEGTTFTEEHAQAITGTDPGTVCTKGFNFGHMTIATELCFGDTEHLKSVTLTLGYETADDATQFQNSNTKLETIPMKFSGTLSYVNNYVVENTAYDTAARSLLYGATAITEVLALYNSAKTWTITTNGQLTAYTKPDPNKSLFENNVTETLCQYSTPAYPITITVA